MLSSYVAVSSKVGWKKLCMPPIVMALSIDLSLVQELIEIVGGFFFLLWFKFHPEVIPTKDQNEEEVCGCLHKLT